MIKSFILKVSRNMDVERKGAYSKMLAAIQFLLYGQCADMQHKATGMCSKMLAAVQTLQMEGH